MNDLQRALANTLVDYVVEHRLAGHRLTEKQRALVVLLALELGMDIKVEAQS